MVIVKIDDVEVNVPEGMTVLNAALQAGIYIPHLCSHPDLLPVGTLKPAAFVYRGNQRLENKSTNLYEGCQLCVVNIEGKDGLQRACNTSVTQGMAVHVNTPEAQESRRNRISFLLAKHPHACLMCAQREGCARFPCSTNVPEKERCCVNFGRCEFQKVNDYVGIKPETSRYVFENIPVFKDEPLFERNYNLCIGCTRCVRACRQLRGTEAIDFVLDEEGRVKIGTVSPSLKDSACRFCTTCVAVCPTGALTDKSLFEDAPCHTACPVEIDVPCYVRLIAEGKFDESYAVVREKLPLPSVCSYICLSFCEAECRRGQLNEPVGIRALKKFVSEHHSDLWKQNLKPSSPTGKKVAIVGAGPAGLTAGYYLARKGHEVTIFEQSPFAGGILRQAISRKRLPQKALDEDIEEIIKAGINLRLNSPVNDTNILLEQGFNAVLVTTGSNFVGTACPLPQMLEMSKVGAAATAATAATAEEGIFLGGDALLGGISEDFIRNRKNGDNFFNQMVNQIVQYRGDSSRSAVRAIASGRKAAKAVDKYLGGNGTIDEILTAPEKASPYIGRKEGFAGLTRLTSPYFSPPPQFAGLNESETPLSEEEAIAEAGRCLRCDLRVTLSKPVLPPKKKLWVEFNAENVSHVPAMEGVLQLLNEQENVIFIKGAMNMRKELEGQLESNLKARFFMYEEVPMYTKKESELLQQYLVEHGEMPEGNRELDDLF
jgi:ferredoxin